MMYRDNTGYKELRSVLGTAGVTQLKQNLGRQRQHQAENSITKSNALVKIATYVLIKTIID
jgi:hypothetical protein